MSKGTGCSLPPSGNQDYSPGKHTSAHLLSRTEGRGRGDRRAHWKDGGGGLLCVCLSLNLPSYITALQAQQPWKLGAREGQGLKLGDFKSQSSRADRTGEAGHSVLSQSLPADHQCWRSLLPKPAPHATLPHNEQEEPSESGQHATLPTPSWPGGPCLLPTPCPTGGHTPRTPKLHQVTSKRGHLL